MIVGDPDRGASGRFNCSVVDRDAAAADRLHFRLRRMFGAEYHLVTSSSLDRERRASYELGVACSGGGAWRARSLAWRARLWGVASCELGVACSDGGPESLSSVKWLRVDVTDVNDNAPRFDDELYTADIYENNYNGKFVLQVGYRTTSPAQTMAC